LKTDHASAAVFNFGVSYFQRIEMIMLYHCEDVLTVI